MNELTPKLFSSKRMAKLALSQYALKEIPLRELKDFPKVEVDPKDFNEALSNISPPKSGVVIQLDGKLDSRSLFFTPALIYGCEGSLVTYRHLSKYGELRYKTLKGYGTSWTICKDSELKFDFYRKHKTLIVPDKGIIHPNQADQMRYECSMLVNLIEDRTVIFYSYLTPEGELVESLGRLGALGVKTRKSKIGKLMGKGENSTFKSLDSLIFHPLYEERDIRLPVEEYGETWSAIEI